MNQQTTQQETYNDKMSDGVRLASSSGFRTPFRLNKCQFKGKAVKAYRQAKGMSQTDLAKATGLLPSAISHFECGRRKPSIDNFCKLCIALEVPPSILLNWYM